MSSSPCTSFCIENSFFVYLRMWFILTVPCSWWQWGEVFWVLAGFHPSWGSIASRSTSFLLSPKCSLSLSESVCKSHCFLKQGLTSPMQLCMQLMLLKKTQESYLYLCVIWRPVLGFLTSLHLHSSLSLGWPLVCISGLPCIFRNCLLFLLTKVCNHFFSCCHGLTISRNFYIGIQSTSLLSLFFSSL